MGFKHLSRTGRLLTGLFLLVYMLASPAPSYYVFGLTPADGPLGANTATPGPLGLPPTTALVPAISAQLSTIQPTYSGCGGINAPLVNATYEQEVIDRVNAIRNAQALPPLKWVPSLNNSARYHATDLGQDDYFEHNSYDRQGGDLVYICEWSSRIQSYYSNWRNLGENIAAGYTTPESVMNGWMNSPGHRNNILSPSFWEIGVGYYQGSGYYFRYWGQNFGRRREVYPLVINREAATTDSPNVSLYLYGDWDEVRLRNDGGSWTAWQPFQSIMDWRLRWTKGERTVWSEMRDGSSTTASSDTILLTTGSPTLGSLPDTVHFAYSIDEGRISPPTCELTPENVGSDDVLSWTITSSGAWFAIAPINGSTPDSFAITPTTFDTGIPGTYTGSATVTVFDPHSTAGSPHQISLSLRVMDRPFFYTHLPLVLR